jgi:hypothetical protein
LLKACLTRTLPQQLLLVGKQGDLGTISLSDKNSTMQRKPLPVFPPVIFMSLRTLLLAFWSVTVWIFGSAYEQHCKPLEGLGR